MRNILTLLLLALAYSTGIHAQAVSGSGAITGMIIDPYGDGLPDTTVVVYNESLGIRRTINTSDDGVFDAQALIPGPGYGLKVSRKGFEGWETANFEVLLGQTRNFTIRLLTEGSTKKPAPGNGLPLVDDNKTEASRVVTPLEIAGLPISGRVLDPLVLLAPSVTADKASGIVAFRGSGLTNSVLTNGSQTTNIFSMREPGIAPQLTPDSLLEAQIISGAATAEFGYSGGGWVNLATRTGTNGWHGTLYDYRSNAPWNSASRFAPGFNPMQKQNQAGARVGGGILPHRLFWFSNFEVSDGSVNGLNRITNPLLGNAAGTAIAPANCTTTAAPCAAAISFLNSQMNVTVPRSQRKLTGFARVDYQRGSSDRISVEANAMHLSAPDGIVNSVVTGNGGLLGGNGTLGDETRYANANWSRAITQTMFNEVYFGWYRDRVSEYADPKLLPSTGLLSINIAGTPVGANPLFPSVLSEQRRSVLDHFTTTRLSHTMRAGVEYSRNEDWLYQLADANGTYYYANLTAFANDFSGNTRLLKNYSGYSQNFGSRMTDLRTTELAAFFQDTWKATTNLTVVLGVRWEKTHIPQPTASNASYFQTCCIGSPSTDFAPRVGLSYRLNDRTVVRAGFGFYYAPFNPELLTALTNDNTVTQTSIWVNPTQTGAPVFPARIATTSGIPAGTDNLAYAVAKFHNPYTQQYTLAIERRVARYTTVTISGIESRGTKLWTSRDANLPPTTTTKTYLIDNASGAQTGTYSTLVWTGRNSPYAHTWEIGNGGSSKYTAGSLEIRQRLWHGLSAQGSYTWSHAVDDVSGPSAVASVPLNTYPGDYRTDQGNSPFDQRHRGVAAFLWQPMPAAKDSPLRWLVNGWQLSAIATIASTMYETPWVLVNGQQFAGISMPFPTSLNGTGGWSRSPLQGAGTLPVGAQHTVDARATREVPIGERVKAVVLFEAFNALNSQFTTSVNTLAYTATGSILRPVAGLGAPNAADGYPWGSNARRCEVAFRIVF